MSSTEPAATRLADYAPPPFLIDEAGLDFELDEARTLVRAKLRVRRNPAAEPAADLVLDGHGPDTRSVRIDGEAVSGNRFEIAAQTLTIRDAPDAFVLDTEVAIAPGANKSLEGLYASSGIGAFCHAISGGSTMPRGTGTGSSPSMCWPSMRSIRSPRRGCWARRVAGGVWMRNAGAAAG